MTTKIDCRNNHPSRLRVLAHALSLELIDLGNLLLLWLTRYRERRKLETLSDHLLKDMGVSRADAEREAMKKFWRG
jgi:uncharacterized protein YjiS (DUF1127 family)